MKVAVILSTYNWPEALNACLLALSKQSLAPDQIIVGDDGSGSATADVIKYWKSRLPLTHKWQEDKGFRAARVRNLCLSAVDADYVICIDSDMVVHKEFVKDHVQFAKKGTFVQGSRVLLGEPYSRKLMSEEERWEWNSNEIKKVAIGNRENLHRSILLSSLIGRKEKLSYANTRTCNMAFWMNDLRKVNGFDNSYVGWGREDSDLTLRLVKAGVKRRKLKFSALALHLYHQEESRASLPENEELIQLAIDNKGYRCANGLKELCSIPIKP